MKGILNMLYNYNKDNYWNLFDIYSSYGSGDTRLPAHAFDWDNSSYWIVNATNPPIDNFLMFCFKKYFVKLTGIEILTSSGNARPKKWSVGVSNSIGKHSQKKVVDVALSRGGSKYVEWSPGVFKCFSYINSGISSRGDYTADVAQIEVFGELIESKMTCKANYRGSYNIVLYMTVILLS